VITTPVIPITHSEIQAFLDCRRAWSWRNVHEYHEPPRYDGALALGSRVHKAIELMRTDPSRTALEHFTELARVDVAALEALVRDGTRPEWQLDQLYEDIVVGRNCVTAYLEWIADEDPYKGYTLEAVERTLEAPILGGRIVLRGKADAIWRRDDGMGLLLEDYKTSGNFTGGQRELLERSYQHHVYIALLQLLEPGEHMIKAQYTILKKYKDLSRITAKPVEAFPVPGTLRSGPNKVRQIENIAKEMLRAIEMLDVEGAALMYPTPSSSCRWCEYKQPCEVVDEDPLAARAMLDRLFVRTPRHARYGTEVR
jgi:RecB family exonuclease